MKAGSQSSFPFLIKSGSGLLTDPITEPTVKIYKNGIETSIIVNISKVSVGFYNAAFIVPSNWIQGDVADAIIIANIQGFEDNVIKRIGEVTIDTIDTAAIERAFVDATDGVDVIGEIASKVSISNSNNSNSYFVTFENPSIENVIKGKIGNEIFFIKDGNGRLVEPLNQPTIKKIQNQNGVVIDVPKAYIALDNPLNGSVIGKYKILLPTHQFEINDTIDVTISISLPSSEINLVKQFKIVAL